MDVIWQIIHGSDALLLFLVIGIGYLLGQVRVGGFGLGVAGVLFAGLAFGAWKQPGSEPFSIAKEVTEVGLILFVYAVGLTSGPGFFTALQRNGVRFNVAVVIALVAGAVVAVLLGRALGLGAELTAGAYCGALTNTPALAAVTTMLQGGDPALSSAPTLGYSIAYPFGVIGGLLAFQALVVLDRRRFAEERGKVDIRAVKAAALPVRGNFEVRRPGIFGRPIGDLRIQDVTGVIISRVRHGSDVFVPTKYTVLNEGDVVLAVGTRETIEKAKEFFGGESEEHLEADEENIEVRRVLVSNKKLVGKSIGELALDGRFNAQVTRLRRADIDLVPSPEMRLQLGDRLRIVMPHDRVQAVSEYFGDSQRDMAELDYTALTLGISLGVLIGMIPLPIPGAGTVKLGFAGGPLLAALILGKLGRTGPITWSIPLEANQALRHIGLLFFLAGVGVKAGSQFTEAVARSGWQLLVLGLTVTVVTTTLTMVLLHLLARPSVAGLMGATSGMQTQPATLARAYELSRSEEVYVTYATTYPVAMIGKIIIAQLLVILGR